MNRDHPIVPGIRVSSDGQATVDASLTDVLFDLALRLEELTSLPVDVEHVLAGVVLAARSKELEPSKHLAVDDPGLITLLAKHVKTVFSQYDGNVGLED